MVKSHVYAPCDHLAPAVEGNPFAALLGQRLAAAAPVEPSLLDGLLGKAMAARPRLEPVAVAAPTPALGPCPRCKRFH